MWFRDYVYFRISDKNEHILKFFFCNIYNVAMWNLAWSKYKLYFMEIHAIGIYWIHLMNKLNVLSVNKYLSICLTFNFISFCWIFFKITDVENIIIF